MEVTELSKELGRQYAFISSGITPVSLIKPCLVGDGIMPLSPSLEKQYIQKYDHLSKSIEIVGFIPSSGAATRMFRRLREFLSTNEHQGEACFFIENIHQFAFYLGLDKTTKEVIKNNSQNPGKCIDLLLNSSQLNLESTPKVLFPFHVYPSDIHTAMEEHIAEAILYAQGKKGAHLHFTISENLSDAFTAVALQLKEKYKAQCPNGLEINCSFQDPATDSIVLDLQNNMVYDQRQPLRRPSGHGALINNLNECNADVVFIKNIDNICHKNFEGKAIHYKKVLAGILLDLQAHIFEVLLCLDKNITPLKQALAYIQDMLLVDLKDKNSDELLAILHKPLRVCGMVVNEGEAGGGPFWVNQEGVNSLQIVETAEINLKDPSQQKILQQASHFNPVDIVFSPKNYKGGYFNLLKYTDPSRGFIVHKNIKGKPIKSMELPGLWNGAMSNWNTVFVEVPVSTFTPVKTIFDLLKPAHIG